jgi:hypothetical protein
VKIQKQSNGWGDEDEEFDDFKPTVMPKLNSGAAVQINK